VRAIALSAFDAIFMFQVLEHIDGMDDFIGRISSIAKADVFVSVPNDAFTSFIEAHGLLVDVPPIHIGRWTRKAFEAAWGRHGFEIVAMESEPASIASFGKLDLSYYFFKQSERHGSIANRVRSMHRGLLRKALSASLAMCYAPARIPLWIKARHGASAWVHLRRRSA
jgi:hypothetical protein